MSKRIIASFLVALMISASVMTPVFAKEPMIKIDGIYEVLKIPAAEADGVTLVALQEVFGLIGATYGYDPYSKKITANKGGKSLAMTLGFTKATLNDKSIEMPVAPTEINYTVMLPLVFICEALDCKVQYDKDKAEYTIKTGRGDLTTLNLNYRLSAQPQYTTYEEALADIIASNSSLLDLKQTVDLLEEQRDKTAKAYRETPPSGSIIPAITYLRGLNTLDTQTTNIPLSEQIIKETSEYMLISSISSIVQAQIDLQLLEQNSKLQAVNVRNQKLKESLGMVSASELSKTQQGYDQVKSNLSIAEMVLEKELTSLKSLLNKNIPEDIVVSHGISYKPLTDSPEHLASLHKFNAPTLQIKKNALAEAEYNLKTHNSYSKDLKESTIEKENAYNKAVREYTDTEKAIETTVRTTYNSVMQLHERQKSLQIDLQKARDTYNTTLSSYNAGMVTIYEVDMAKLAITKAEADIVKNDYSLWALMYLLEHPYLSTK